MESETAHFQVLLPKQWKWSNDLKPMVVQLAGTGDHVIQTVIQLIDPSLTAIDFKVLLAKTHVDGQTPFE